MLSYHELMGPVVLGVLAFCALGISLYFRERDLYRRLGVTQVARYVWVGIASVCFVAAFGWAYSNGAMVEVRPIVQGGLIVVAVLSCIVTAVFVYLFPSKFGFRRGRIGVKTEDIRSGHRDRKRVFNQDRWFRRIQWKPDLTYWRSQWRETRRNSHFDQ